MTLPEILWEGELNTMKVRIRRAALGEEDCIVELFISYHGDERWDALNDDAECAAVFMKAYLESRKALALLYERDMGNLTLKTGFTALEDAGRVLRMPDI